MPCPSQTAPVQTRNRFILAGVMALLLAGCSIGALDNPRFIEFCGDTPCDWDVEGDISQAPTWHRSDLGLSLDTPGTRISQRAGLTSGCVRVSIRANIATTAAAYLEFDYYNDGEPELERELPPGVYEEFVLKTALPPAHSSAPLHVAIHKRGSGTLIVSQFYMERDGGCDAPSNDFVAGPLGVPCSADTECQSGQCARTRWPLLGSLAGAHIVSHCSDCAAEGTCAFQTTCDAHSQCASGSCINGGCGCASDDQCDAGDYCSHGTCGECRTDDDCSVGERCAAPASYVHGPLRCLTAEQVAQDRPDGVLCDRDEQCRSLDCSAAGDIPPRCGGTCASTADCAGGTCALFLPPPDLLTRYSASDLSELEYRYERFDDPFGLVSALYGSTDAALLITSGQPTMCVDAPFP